jgi:transcriptional regulator with XRE-family HTH domain
VQDSGKIARHLASALETLMKARDVSVTDLHKRTGISRETIYRILRAASLPTTDVLLRLANEFRVSPGALLDNTTEKLGGAKSSIPREGVASASTLAAIQAKLETIENLLRRKEA